VLSLSYVLVGFEIVIKRETMLVEKLSWTTIVLFLVVAFLYHVPASSLAIQWLTRVFVKTAEICVVGQILPPWPHKPTTGIISWCLGAFIFVN
jgi:hypothetical protein